MFQLIRLKVLETTTSELTSFFLYRPARLWYSNLHVHIDIACSIYCDIWCYNAFNTCTLDIVTLLLVYTACTSYMYTYPYSLDLSFGVSLGRPKYKCVVGTDMCGACGPCYHRFYANFIRGDIIIIII